MSSSSKCFLLSIVTLGLISYYLSQGITWNLNRSIGWGWEFENLCGIALMILLTFSLVKMLVTLVKEKINGLLLVALILNSFSVYLVARLIYELAPIFIEMLK